MWIRSQNREILINVRRLFVNEVLEDKKISGYSIDSGGIELGRFSTKEKALDVMDEIEKNLENNNLVSISYSGMCKKSSVAFQIPKDNEVQI